MTESNLYQPEFLNRWNHNATAFDSDRNYIGADFSEFYCAPIGKNNQNEANSLVRSNWEVVTKDIHVVSQHPDTDEYHFGHWACAYDLFLIHESDTEALKVADRWAKKLNDYGVADEMLMGEYELQNQSDQWDSTDRGEFRNHLYEIYNDRLPEEVVDNREELAEEMVDDLSDDRLWELFQQSQSLSGYYYENEDDYGQWSINWFKVLQATSELVRQSFLPQECPGQLPLVFA